MGMGMGGDEDAHSGWHTPFCCPDKAKRGPEEKEPSLVAQEWWLGLTPGKHFMGT